MKRLCRPLLLLLAYCGGPAVLSAQPPAMTAKTVPVVAAAGKIPICPGSFADNTGASDASAAIQACLDRLPEWVMPAGVYKLGTALDIKHPVVWSGNATLTAATNITGTAGHDMVKAGYVNRVTLRGLTFDGNRANRATAFCDGTVKAYAGSNVQFDHVDNAIIEGVTTRNAVCGSGMHFSGNRAVIRGNTFEANGAHSPRQWADGLTLLQCSDCEVSANRFINNSDVSLVFGGGTNTVIRNNTFIQTTPIFAALALDNFNGSQSGNFIGTKVFGNTIDCACDFGINVGPHAWYPSANILGGAIYDNDIKGAKIGIMVDGAGTAAHPVSVYGNRITPKQACRTLASFSCGPRQVCERKISPDAFVNAQEAPVLLQAHHQCP